MGTATRKRPKRATTGRRPAEQPVIGDFRPGGLYSVRQVAALFGKSKPWVRDLILADPPKLAAVRIDDTSNWIIPGESVRVLYGTLKLADDVAAGPPTPLPEDDRKGRKKALDALADLGRMGK